MKRLLAFCVITLLVFVSLSAGENEVQCKFKPHFQANLDLKALYTGHMIHRGDFTVVPGVPPIVRFNLDMPAGGPGLDLVLGGRVKEYFFIGGGISLNWWLNADSQNQWSFIEAPIGGEQVSYGDMLSRFGMGWAFYAAPRFYLPIKKAKDITPYFDFALGFCQFFMMLKDHGINQYKLDVYAHAGFGVDIKRFNISAGYQYSYNSNGYLRVGYRF